jgi:hypothetical protein
MKIRILIIILLVFCIATESVKANENEAGNAAQLVNSMPVIDNRELILSRYLAIHDSPVQNYAANFIEAADSFNLDWRFVVAIAGLESTFCKHIPQNSYNCWGWGIPTGANDGIHFYSFNDGIYQVSAGLRNNYFTSGLFSVNQIGKIYAASPTWAYRVKSIMTDITNFGQLESSSLLSMNL